MVCYNLFIGAKILLLIRRRKSRLIEKVSQSHKSKIIICWNEMTNKILVMFWKNSKFFAQNIQKCIVDLFKKPYKIPKINFSFLDYSSSIIALKKSNFYPPKNPYTLRKSFIYSHMMSKKNLSSVFRVCKSYEILWKYRRIVVALDKRMMIINKRIIRSFSKKVVMSSKLQSRLRSELKLFIKKSVGYH